jgi:hypothetical protein
MNRNSSDIATYAIDTRVIREWDFSVPLQRVLATKTASSLQQQHRRPFNAEVGRQVTISTQSCLCFQASIRHIYDTSNTLSENTVKVTKRGASTS